ncbi:MAG: tyrosinase family protein, partial [Acidobacteriota bacterium]|nr:tyrosinase family protein [Acidobacteriota bacterium]
SDPDTAGLDPIFYLHHANIDRLWEVWIQGPVSLGNPTDTNWTAGPTSVGDRGFSMPLPPKGDGWDYAPSDVGDLSKLDYEYEDVSAPAVTPMPPGMLRLQRLGISPAAAATSTSANEGVAAMATSKRRVELVGANQESLRISGIGDVRSAVRLDKTVQRKVSASLRAAAEEAPPDRVFLNLENVRSVNDATMLNVYVNERPAGNISLFGVRRASMPDSEHGGEGLTFVLEITDIVDELHLQSGLDVDKLEVRIEPTTPVPENAAVSIGRMSIFRQGR